jgi:hypothetical protein
MRSAIISRFVLRFGICRVIPKPRVLRFGNTGHHVKSYRLSNELLEIYSAGRLCLVTEGADRFRQGIHGMEAIDDFHFNGASGVDAQFRDRGRHCPWQRREITQAQSCRAAAGRWHGLEIIDEVRIDQAQVTRLQAREGYPSLAAELASKELDSWMSGRRNVREALPVFGSRPNTARQASARVAPAAYSLANFSWRGFFSGLEPRARSGCSGSADCFTNSASSRRAFFWDCIDPIRCKSVCHNLRGAANAIAFGKPLSIASFAPAKMIGSSEGSIRLIQIT